MTSFPHYNQVHLVQKKDDTWRFCIDFRGLNDAIKSHGWRIPNIKNLLQKLGEKRAHYFGKMDLTSGYFQAPIAAESRPFTSFVTDTGVYQWTRVPMGIKCAGAYFQQQMQFILDDLVENICFLYLDDIVVFGRTEAEYLQNVDAVLQRLQQRNVYLSPKKCSFGMTEVEYVGHVVSAEGLTFSKEKINKVVNFPRPENQKSLRSFLGLTNYFRDNIEKYADITAPLQSMLVDYKKSRRLNWTTALLDSFNGIQRAIRDIQMLYFLNDDDPIFLHTDASDHGIGAYLFQVVDGKERPIQFLSKTMNEVQQRWSTTEKECYY